MSSLNLLEGPEGECCPRRSAGCYMDRGINLLDRNYRRGCCFSTHVYVLMYILALTIRNWGEIVIKVPDIHDGQYFDYVHDYADQNNVGDKG